MDRRRHRLHRRYRNIVVILSVWALNSEFKKFLTFDSDSKKGLDKKSFFVICLPALKFYLFISHKFGKLRVNYTTILIHFATPVFTPLNRRVNHKFCEFAMSLLSCALLNIERELCRRYTLRCKYL